MAPPFQSPILLKHFILTLGFSVVANLLLARVSWAGALINPVLHFSKPPSDSKIIFHAGGIAADTRIAANESYLTQNPAPESVPTPDSSNEEGDTPSSPASSNPVETRETPTSETNARGNLNVPFGEGDFTYGIGSLLPEPTALEGPTRSLSVSAQSSGLAVISITGHVQQRLAENQTLLLEFRGDPQQLGVDLSYNIAPSSLPGSFSANVFNRRSLSPAFENGEEEVNLPNGADPWVHRTGGGIEYRQSVAPQLDIAAALNYQSISVRDAAFSDELEPVDELGNSLTVSNEGRDDLLTLKVTGLLNEVEGQNFAFQGTRSQFAIYQSIPIGDANIFFNRVVASVTQFVPLRLFTHEPGTFIMNLQGGVTFGDVPPYEALSLGGSNSVRGFARGEVGAGSSFIQATAEYRFPLFSFRALNAPIETGGVLFVDYASDLGTSDSVIGSPADVRGKPGNGLGYGLGLHLATPFGLFRFELGFNDNSGSTFHFVIGDRF